MFLLVFFINRPLTILPYLVGMCCLITFASMIEVEGISVVVGLLGILFTMWYSAFLIRYHILNDRESHIWGIKIHKFRLAFSVFLGFHLVAMATAVCGLLYFQNGFQTIFLLIFYLVLSTIIFQLTIRAKVLSEAFKNDLNLKEWKLEELYLQIRELFLKKVIR